ncbi:MAG: hypothetical protein RLZZ42_1206, partial [Bacteroidota bacterium]
MELLLNDQERIIIGHVAHAAAALEMDAFVVGGFVRDKLLNRNCVDIDIVCLGDAIALAEAVGKRLRPLPKISWFKNFGTAHLNTMGYDVEFVGARKESYQRNSRNPLVTPGTLQDDQERRDFTINALAFAAKDMAAG